MTMAQTPLLGDENTPMHTGPGGGTGFESATPRHQVAFTPNPLATPYTSSGGDVGGTPRAGPSQTPLRTPLRDNLALNDGHDAVKTPRDLSGTSAKRALKAGFMNFPKPENNFELLVPEDEEEEEIAQELSEEDAAERDARLKKLRDEQERRELARRSQVVRLGLPRPANVDVRQLVANLNALHPDDPELSVAQELVNEELANLLYHDSLTYPIAGTSHAGGTQSSYVIPDDEDMHSASSLIQLELASLVGFPSASSDQVREGLMKLAASDPLDASNSWTTTRRGLVFDVSTKVWVAPDTLSEDARVAGYTVQLNEVRDLMSQDATKAGKSEKKLGVILGGFQLRSQASTKRIADAFTELQKCHIDYESFSRLKINETAAGPRRVDALKEEVEKLQRRERLLQERYGELAGERREVQGRVAVLEDKLMEEAEAMNDAALAEIEEVEQ